VYFDELVRHADMDTLADSSDVLATTAAAAAAHSNLHATTPANPHSGHQFSRQRTSLSPVETVDVSPTDLSVRRDHSNTAVDGASFTSPSSGFDSPSMHAAGK